MGVSTPKGAPLGTGPHPPLPMPVPGQGPKWPLPRV